MSLPKPRERFHLWTGIKKSFIFHYHYEIIIKLDSFMTDFLWIIFLSFQEDEFGTQYWHTIHVCHTKKTREKAMVLVS